uniref:Uncharacterized protein n=1 Tax=Oryza sativa subsp. japonica TaxID=39947 RepID=Q6K5L6_ORYSJ|nr:hypothetical protein [Oryza sativa Japonica Group]BAD22109.1 hypothetical protein [Oryza sativa Japonica Group]
MEAVEHARNELGGGVRGDPAAIQRGRELIHCRGLWGIHRYLYHDCNSTPTSSFIEREGVGRPASFLHPLSDRRYTHRPLTALLAAAAPAARRSLPATPTAPCRSSPPPLRSPPATTLARRRFALCNWYCWMCGPVRSDTGCWSDRRVSSGQTGQPMSNQRDTGGQTDGNASVILAGQRRSDQRWHKHGQTDKSTPVRPIYMELRNKE